MVFACAKKCSFQIFADTRLCFHAMFYLTMGKRDFDIHYWFPKCIVMYDFKNRKSHKSERGVSIIVTLCRTENILLVSDVTLPFIVYIIQILYYFISFCSFFNLCFIFHISSLSTTMFIFYSCAYFWMSDWCGASFGHWHRKVLVCHELPCKNNNNNNRITLNQFNQFPRSVGFFTIFRHKNNTHNVFCKTQEVVVMSEAMVVHQDSGCQWALCVCWRQQILHSHYAQYTLYYCKPVFFQCLVHK